MICLSCTEETLNEALGTIEKSIKYIDAVEIRADYLLPSEYHLLAEFPSKIKLPCILTFRWPKDGGNDKTLSIAERAEILSKALDGHWAYFDIEDDADSSDEKLLVKKAEDSGVKVIKSFHDFTGVPDNLAQRIIKNSYGNRFIPKAAVMSNSTEDFLKIVQAHKDIQKEIELSNGYSCTNGPFLTDYILVGMGDYGFPSRILAGVFGSMLTFCSSGKAAPGHVNPEIMSELYNYNNLNENTKVFGIIGNPVMHSKSPDIHNPAFQQKNIDAVYINFKNDNPEELLNNSDLINLCGLSVTMPHKKTVIDIAGSVDESVKAIGACNTLVKKDCWSGYNTDWQGFLAPIEGDLNPAGCLYKSKALVLGAGGAARAVVFALVKKGIDVVIANRTASKAEKLASQFSCKSMSLDEVMSSNFNSDDFKLIVQTTNLGMHPYEDKTPLPEFNFSNTEIVYDLIYNPEKTVFLKDAESCGCRIINGYPMLKAQAEVQFKLFTGKDMS